jgi:hypothetical protein
MEEYICIDFINLRGIVYEVDFELPCDNDKNKDNGANVSDVEDGVVFVEQ